MDQLNRLTQAASSKTGTQGFAYDGFGNLTQQGTTTFAVDAATNRLATSAGYQHDANGNLTRTPDGTGYDYDVVNRMKGPVYDPQNRRVFDGTTAYLYGVEGLIGKYRVNFTGVSVSILSGAQPNIYLGGRLLLEGGQWVMTDRLGSVRVRSTGERHNYYPYGAEVTPTGNARTKFATYYRDSAGVDYASQRYYGNALGRFFTPDPGNTVRPGDPGSWNRFAYVQGDPVNFTDRWGLAKDEQQQQEFPEVCDTNFENAGQPGSCYPQQSGHSDLRNSPPPCPVQVIQGYSYDCIHRSGPDWDFLAKELRHVAKLVQNDSQCFKLLSSKVGSKDLKGIYLKKISDYFEIANSITNPSMAGTILGTYGIPVNGIPIVLSDTAIGASTHDLRGLILHEVAHLVGAIASDGNDPTATASMDNQKKIDEDCAKTPNAK